MATRRPLVIVNGSVGELPSGDVLPGADGLATPITKSALDAAATAGQLVTNSVYRVTDLGTAAIANSAASYASLIAGVGTARITVSPTPPASPQVNDLWIAS